MIGQRYLERRVDGFRTGIGEKDMVEVAWQQVAGERIDVPVVYVVKEKSYGFELGAFDPTLPVVIDPLLSATFPTQRIRFV